MSYRPTSKEANPEKVEVRECYYHEGWFFLVVHDDFDTALQLMGYKYE